HRVEIILDDFRSGNRDVAEFWIQAGEETFVHIRYFALRDGQGEYKGCIEVTQNVAHIRSLEGEKRLLDDAPGYAD
ncbi:MAG: PAS domain-containing protein, partial [Chloroflexota bacterium]|nr:PAS domain-containing protein [Chloroflexota bacterium]